MNIIVAGCGRVGAELAYSLFRRGHHVTVVDYQSAAFNNLPQDFRGRTIQGEVLNKQVLHRAGIERTDGMAMVTSSDTVNAVVAHAAKVVYGIGESSVWDHQHHRKKLRSSLAQSIRSFWAAGSQLVKLGGAAHRGTTFRAQGAYSAIRG